ncbi:MAG TPA: MBL fold metallo-hydrolase [Rectinemataceae bacterium]|nr:MBL fold metallo-hydrolase [Rectinemataceae bacterium]
MSAFSLTVIGHWGAYPGPGEATSCYLLRAEGMSVLLDCGSGALSLLQDILPLGKIDAVVLSHYHSDHIADLGCLQYSARIDMDLGRRAAPLKVFGHDLGPGSEKLGYLDFAIGATYKQDSTLNLGPFSLTFAPTIHPDPCFAMRVCCGGSSLVYSGDTGPSPNLAGFAAGADLLLCETSLYDEYRGKIPGHMSAGEAGELAKAAGVGTLMATHLPHFGVHADLLVQAKAAFGGNTILARRNMMVQL